MKNENKSNAVSDMSFEDKFKGLEEVSAGIKNRNVSLEDALKLYEEGIKLYRECRLVLDNAAGRIAEFDKELDEFKDL